MTHSEKYSRYIFVIGLMIAIVATFLEVYNGKFLNFKIFSYATRDFWEGIIPYGPQWMEYRGLDNFIYGPSFNVLFAPFAFLPIEVGVFVWNLFNFTMLYLAVYSLPHITTDSKNKLFCYILLPLGASILSSQYNIAVAYIYLFAYSLLERGKPFWAILLIMISGITKIYGLFELALLLCYPRFWRNIGYVLLTGLIILALPLLKLSFSELIYHYQRWIDGIMTHEYRADWQTFFYLWPWREFALAYAVPIRIVVLAALGALFIAGKRHFKDQVFRIQSLGILMCWIILFGGSSEKHTYIIALCGYLFWYFSRKPELIDKILLWANFVFMCWMPVDILCPTWIMNIFCTDLKINVWVFLIVWLRMVYVTFIRDYQVLLPIKNSNTK